MRKVLAYFIKYPVAVNVLLIGIVIFGIGGLRQLNSSYFPLFPTTTININIGYPGASPQEMEEGIVLKIEDNLRGLVGIDRVTSRSSENSATITVEILEDYDIDNMLQEVKNAVDRVPNFPSDMEPPIVAKREIFNEAISFTVSGKDIPLKTLKQMARAVENDIRAIDGISQVETTGFPKEEIEIAVREKDLRAYDLTFDDVARAVSQTNILTTGGNIKTETEEYLIRANNKVYYGDELDYAVVRAKPSGEVIRLKDVATVRDRWNESPDRLYFNDNMAVEIRVSTTNDEDFLAAADHVNAYIGNFNATHDNVQLNVVNDRAISLRQRTDILVQNGAMGIMLVLIFLSLFLKPSLAFWVAVGLPISFFGMFIFSPYFMTINVMSLFGMIVVIGILVDDGIVIGENIYHHFEKGKSATQAAIDGTMEVSAPIISAILTTIVAFSVFFFLEGRMGNFYYQVAIVVILTLSISLIEALIILPAHISHSRAMNKGAKGKGFLLNRYADKFMVWLRDDIYGPILYFFLKNRFLGFAIPIALLLLTVGSIGGGIIGLSFFPSLASDRVTINLKMPQGTSETITDDIISMVEDSAWSANVELSKLQIDGQPVIQNIIKRIGPGTSSATLSLNLLPGEFRELSSFDIAGAIREKVGPVYGVESLTFGSGGHFGGSPVSVSLKGNNIGQLKAAKEELKLKMSEMPMLKDISDNDPLGIKEIKLELKENAYLLGLTLNNVMSQVRAGFFGRSVQRFQRGRDEIRVWVRYDRDERESIKSLDDMWIVTPDRSRVPLSEIAEYEIARGEISINHLDGIREIQVSADLRKRNESALDVLNDVRTTIMPSILAQYPTVIASYEGQNRQADKLSSSVATIVPAILFLIYIIIAFTFRSYSQPLLLFILIPFSLIGVAWGHWLHGFPISMLSMLGIIALIGILVNDGLVLIGKFNLYLKEGMPFDKALFQAAKSRFRAIFLTSLTTVAGLGPLIFETSRSAQFLIPMAISIAYGILIATFLTLLLLPLLLSTNNSIKVGQKWLITGNRPEREDVERVVKEKKQNHEELVEV